MVLFVECSSFPNQSHHCGACQSLSTTNVLKGDVLGRISELLSLIEHGTSEKLIICSDFKMPGENINIDDWLSTLLDVHDYQQLITEPTRTAISSSSLSLPAAISY